MTACINGFFAIFIIYAFSGCLLIEEERPVVGKITDYAKFLNNLSYDDLNNNRISIDDNRFYRDPQNPNTMIYDRQIGVDLATADGGIEVLKRLASCALTESEVLQLEQRLAGYPDFPGKLGFAPSLGSGSALSLTEQRLVSACMIAQLNAMDKEVCISLRAKDAAGNTVVDTESGEQTEFAFYEGTFFGNIFLPASQALELYSCQGNAPNDPANYSEDREYRVGTDDPSDLFIEVQGSCSNSNACNANNGNYGHTNCSANGELYSQTISVYLRNGSHDSTCEN
ncbi:MAG: hypothetical protein MJE77_24790 [Proteobacteria bacterium]|nr:hypothetical protein [Pseudomonadota bacterium]